jgi:hypothetical protein
MEKTIDMARQFGMAMEIQLTETSMDKGEGIG